MVDSELFKVVRETGLFGLFILGFLWLLFKAEPNYRATVERMAANHQAVVEAITATFKESLREQLTNFQSILGNVQKDFKDSLESHEKQCRSERKEWMECVRQEGELNRDSRHDLANRLTSIYAETFGILKERERKQRERGDSHDE